MTALHCNPDAHADDIAALRARADQGDAEAQVSLGFMYGNGRGVVQDYKQAVVWYRKAADQGETWSQFNLGVMYHKGRGVVQDYKQAVVWYRKAADQGDANAQYSLGVMYFTGQGVAQNYVQAHKWVNLAAANSTGETHEQAARNRSIVEEKMTPQQVAEAQRLAGEWQVRQP